MPWCRADVVCILIPGYQVYESSCNLLQVTLEMTWQPGIYTAGIRYKQDPCEGHWQISRLELVLPHVLQVQHFWLLLTTLSQCKQQPEVLLPKVLLKFIPRVQASMWSKVVITVTSDCLVVIFTCLVSAASISNRPSGVQNPVQLTFDSPAPPGRHKQLSNRSDWEAFSTM